MTVEVAALTIVPSAMRKILTPQKTTLRHWGSSPITEAR